MSENTNSVESNGTSEKTTRTPVVVIEYDTKEECEANRPAGADVKNKKGEYAWKPINLTNPDGSNYWIWSVGSVNALAYDAKKRGTSASLGGVRGSRKATINSVMPDEAVKNIAAMPDNQREAMLTALGADDALRARVEAARSANGNATARKPAGKPRALAGH